MKLELGSGYSPTEGYLHLDLNPHADPDVLAPAFPLPAAWADRFEEIRAVDVLEHLSYRDTDLALANWAATLAPGGRLFVQVPDAATVMRWYVEGDPRLLERIPDDLHQTREAGAAWRLLGGHADGEAVHDGDDWRWNAHFALFSRDSLWLALERAGLLVELIERNDHPNLLAWARRP